MVSTSDQADAVAIFAPWSSPEEQALRRRLYRARDVANVRAARSTCPFAGGIFALAGELAEGAVFARMPLETLGELLKILSWLFLACGALERLGLPDGQ